MGIEPATLGLWHLFFVFQQKTTNFVYMEQVIIYH